MTYVYMYICICAASYAIVLMANNILFISSDFRRSFATMALLFQASVVFCCSLLSWRHAAQSRCKGEGQGQRKGCGRTTAEPKQGSKAWHLRRKCLKPYEVLPSRQLSWFIARIAMVYTDNEVHYG